MKGKSRADYWRNWYNNRGGKAKVKASIRKRQLESLYKTNLIKSNMTKYLNLQGFISFLNSLKDNNPVKLHTESTEDGSIQNYTFMKMEFSGNTIILYDHPMCQVGIIQDSPVAPWDDYAEGVYEDFTMNDEYKLFIEEQ